MIDFETLVEPQGHYDQSELFLTSFDEIRPQEAITDLTDQSFAHAFTGTTPTLTNSNKSDPFTYNTTSRYTSNKFYGIMIDTRALKRSIAG